MERLIVEEFTKWIKLLFHTADSYFEILGIHSAGAGKSEPAPEVKPGVDLRSLSDSDSDSLDFKNSDSDSD